MLREFRIFTFAMLFTLLVSCGSSSDPEPQTPIQPTEAATQATEQPTQEATPSDEQIKEDLQDSLTAYESEFDLTITDCVLNKSFTEDRSFSAELSITAQATYAEFTYTADVDYTLYDQGWMMDSCDWSNRSYEIIKYPTKEEMPALASIYDESLAEYTCTELVPDGDVISVTLETSDHSRNYIDFPSIIRIRPWYYDSTFDNWFASEGDYEISEMTFALKPELAGIWEDLEGGLYVISNVTENGFDISCDAPMIFYESAHISFNEITTYEGDYRTLIDDARTTGSANDKWGSGCWLHDKTLSASVELTVHNDSESLVVVSSHEKSFRSFISAGSRLTKVSSS